MLRAEAGREPHDRALRELIGELSTLSTEFRSRWAAHDVRIRHDGAERLWHPQVGQLELTYQSLDLPLSGRTARRLAPRADPGLPHAPAESGARSMMRATVRCPCWPGCVNEVRGCDGQPPMWSGRRSPSGRSVPSGTPPPTA
ncbi:MmyB family transcriptional regulator [Nonomuraea ceibae]|uniref:MmyB family transcriptional regulator n=1 Tax=Nonomuraea ceibae TaxID=1935170 RepID=UPI002484916D|nr:hypothetical protein [Nonomuraea ceibae]